MAQKKLPKFITAQIKDYVRVLREDKLPVSMVIVFGSHAKGLARKNSDIDICVVSPRFTDSFSALQYLWRKKRTNHLDLEPIGLSPKNLRAKTSLAREIQATGINLKV